MLQVIIGGLSDWSDPLGILKEAGLEARLSTIRAHDFLLLTGEPSTFRKNSRQLLRSIYKIMLK